MDSFERPYLLLWSGRLEGRVMDESLVLAFSGSERGRSGFRSFIPWLLLG